MATNVNKVSVLVMCVGTNFRETAKKGCGFGPINDTGDRARLRIPQIEVGFPIKKRTEVLLEVMGVLAGEEPLGERAQRPLRLRAPPASSRSIRL